MDITLLIVPIAVALITAVLGPMALEWLKNKFSKKPQDTLGEAIKLNEIVDEQLEDISIELGCNRIWVAQFHNGGHFYPTGKSIQKFSIFYEKITPNIPSLLETFQNIPVSLFPKLLSKLHEHDEIHVNKYDTNREDFGLHSLANDLNTKSMYIFKIKDLNDQFIAILGMSFIESEHKLTHGEENFIKQKVGVMGTILDSYLYNK